jgi:stage IV sporulation protein FB
MFHLTETEPTRVDWRFRLFGTSVRVHPLFWILPLLLAGDARDAWRVLFWVVVVFVSILVHEFGHILAMRLFGGDGYIVLGGYGGLAISPSARYHRWSNDVFVSAAGPLAGMLFACAIAGFGIQFRRNQPHFLQFDWHSTLVHGLLAGPLDGQEYPCAPLSL